MLQLKVRVNCYCHVKGFMYTTLCLALLINEDTVAWAVAGDQIIITLQGMDITKIK